ncbi:MAG: hypothetical protein ACXWUG_09270 [Polyangiales bacterium]
MTPRWSFGEATVLRATGLMHLGVMAMGLITPAALLGAWSLPFGEPATFTRAFLLVYGALGLALVRAVRLPREQGWLLVETVGLAKLAFFAVIVADIMARKLPNRAAIAVILDVIFGIALYRAGRRSSPQTP